MRTMIRLPFAVIIAVLFTETLMAQDCVPLFAVKEGSVREMTSYDKKDKLTGTTIQTVKEITTSGDRTDWTIGVVTKDEKDKEVTSGDMHMSCEKGIFRMDMRNFLDEKTMQGFEGMEVSMDATDLDYPSDLSVGQDLDDGSITVKVSSSGITMMTMVIRVYDRKVEAIEDITTPAGTFSCYKMSSTIETKSMFSMLTKSIDWIAKDVGSVRSETYDKGDKLLSYSVLTSFK